MLELLESSLDYVSIEHVHRYTRNTFRLARLRLNMGPSASDATQQHVSLSLYRCYNTLLYSTLLYSTLLYSTLLYSTLLYSTLLYSTLLYSTLLYYYSIVTVVCLESPQDQIARPPAQTDARTAQRNPTHLGASDTPPCETPVRSFLEDVNLGFDSTDCA